MQQSDDDIIVLCRGQALLPRGQMVVITEKEERTRALFHSSRPSSLRFRSSTGQTLLLCLYTTFVGGKKLEQNHSQTRSRRTIYQISFIHSFTYRTPAYRVLPALHRSSSAFLALYRALACASPTRLLSRDPSGGSSGCKHMTALYVFYIYINIECRSVHKHKHE